MTQTDDLLSKLYDQLRNTGNSFSLVYFSDHGLAFKERGKEVQYLAMMTSSSRTSRCRLWCCRVMTKRTASSKRVVRE
jgi:glucan phosphoethanolaminetransferase (alkaline phosphatase superfamily)